MAKLENAEKTCPLYMLVFYCSDFSLGFWIVGYDNASLFSAAQYIFFTDANIDLTGDLKKTSSEKGRD